MKRVTVPFILILCLLSACASAGADATVAPSTSGAGPTTAPPPRNTPTAADPMPAYSNSFDEISDVSSSGINAKNSTFGINMDITKSGAQSLEVSSQSGAQEFGVEFSILSITGRNSLDISKKAITISVFIPKDSSVNNINFAFSGGGKTVIIPVRQKMGIYTQWFREGINLSEFFNNPKTFVSGGDWNQAVSILNHCEAISLVGSSPDASSAAARFLVDDLSWANWAEPTVDPNIDSLKKYAPHGLQIGSVLQSDPGAPYMLDPSFWPAFPQEFNFAWIGTASGWPLEQPADPANINFDYSVSDKRVALASQYNLSMKMFAGTWHAALPMWLMDTPFDRMQSIAENRVTKDISHNRGKIILWDVFNETLLDNGTFRNRELKSGENVSDITPYGADYSPWVNGKDTSVIRAAFYKARETDPDAKLFLNDAYNEQIGKKKSEFFYQFVSDLKRDGVPIDGVGFQMHLEIWGDTNLITWDQIPIATYLANVEKNVKRYADLGISVEFSEIEVAVRTDDLDLTIAADRVKYEQRLQRQAQVYGGLMKIAKENQNVTAFIFWNISDTWSNVVDNIYWPEHQIFGTSAIFDTYYQPKPAYDAILKVLKGE
jgi:endo-1,4-beta-xylanase